tara:strand:- start:477 stop:845 length:369 start_codon:yes stop_codon:yes gene_type:complete
MDRDNQIQYIYENIDKINNHQNYIKLLTYHDCSYTTNSNGIFVNLNKLDDKVINDFFIRIKNELTNDSNVEDSYEKQIKNIKENKNKKKSKVRDNRIEDIITIDSFNKEDKEIIKYSKRYNL